MLALNVTNKTKEGFMDNTFIINKTGEKVAEAIDKALKIDEKLLQQKAEIDKEITTIRDDLSALGLSIVDGKLCITYEEE